MSKYLKSLPDIRMLHQSKDSILTDIHMTVINPDDHDRTFQIIVDVADDRGSFLTSATEFVTVRRFTECSTVLQPVFQIPEHLNIFHAFECPVRIFIRANGSTLEVKDAYAAFAETGNLSAVYNGNARRLHSA